MQKQLILEYKGEELSGILIKEDEKYMTLKLKSGYNANIKKSDAKIISEKNIEIKSNGKTTIKINNSLPKVAILHTGGTIASKVDYKTGAVSWKFTPEELLHLYPELLEIANIDAKMIRNMASDDMRFEHYNILIDEIEKSIKEGAKGVIISHGTDTLHYSAAALSYAFEELSVPIILVGAQRSSDRASSDASSNLRAAVNFILHNEKSKEKYNRVGICMHEGISDDSFLIIDGINSKKTHSSRRDSFKQINYLPFAIINKKDEVEILRNEILTNENKKVKHTKFNVKLKIGLIKIHPHSFPEEFTHLNFYNAVIIEATGLGHLPISQIDEYTKSHSKILEEIKSLVKKDKKIVIATQCCAGEVCMDVYSPGRILNKTGVLGNRMNLIPETLFMRLAYCLSKDKKNFEELWNSNLEGFECRSVDVNMDL